MSDIVVALSNHFSLLATVVSEQMKQGVDYGKIPGTGKPTLLKPGADKLCRLFGLYPIFTVLTAVEDFSQSVSEGSFPLFHYRYRCELFRFEGGAKVGEGIGSCNSYEGKYHFRKGSPNAAIFDQVNTIDKMAQKRAYVGAVILAVNASEFFTQDLEDLYQEVVEDVMGQIKNEVTRLGWDPDTAKSYLSKYPKYKGKLTDLSEHQLQEFLAELKAL